MMSAEDEIHHFGRPATVTLCANVYAAIYKEQQSLLLRLHFSLIIILGLCILVARCAEICRHAVETFTRLFGLIFKTIPKLQCLV